MATLKSRLGDSEKTLYLIDVSSFIFRAFFAIRPLHTKSGEPVNAVYGVATMLARLAEEAEPQYLAVIYDSKEPSFREEIYPEYKANRDAPPDDLIPQFDRVEELVSCFGIHSYRESGVEADDLIATLTKRWTAEVKDHRVVIVSSDKDLMQLVTDRVQLWDTMSNKIYGVDEVVEKFGVKPSQIRDYLGLVGDSSDNIPGVPSVGPKTASDLLREHGDIDGILKAAKAGKIAGKKCAVLVEHEKDARLSAQLATVKDDLEVEIPFAELSYRFHVDQKCADFLSSLDFHSLVAKWSGKESESKIIEEKEKPAAGKSAHDPTPVSASDFKQPFGTKFDSIIEDSTRFRCVNTREAFEEVLKGIEKAGEFGFDIETTSLNPRAAELVGVSLCYDPDFAVYIPVGHIGSNLEQLDEKYVLSKLKPFLENEKIGKIGQNLKYDFSVMSEMGFHPHGIKADTMVAGYVLNPEGRQNLETLAMKYLGYKVMTFEEVCGKGKNQLSFDQVPIDVATRYSAEDSWVAMKLWQKLEGGLASEGLMDIYSRVDLPLVPVLSQMERTGVCIDVPYLQKLSKEFDKDLRAIETRIQAFSLGPINLNSPKQIGTLLFETLKLPVQGKTKTGFSTDASVLDALAPLHEVPAMLLEYREISKLKGTYVDPLPLLRDPKTGKIHASFHQAVTSTGRLSSSDPNLQNIPIRSERGQRIRKAFIPSEGNVLLAADYSQIELRLLAHMSRDPELSRSFQVDEDVHRRTAAEIFGIDPKGVDDRQRSIAKAINFGLMYGKSAFALAQELKISRTEAKEVIEKYFIRYRGVKNYLDGIILDAKEKGYVSTLMGRKRFLPDIRAANAAVRAGAERMAMNAPIQGTAADLMKLAMIEIDQELQLGKFKSRLTIQVHDEVVLDCARGEADTVMKMVVRVMEGAMKLSVPLRVNAAIGDNWMEL